MRWHRINQSVPGFLLRHKAAMQRWLLISKLEVSEVIGCCKAAAASARRKPVPKKATCASTEREGKTGGHACNRGVGAQVGRDSGGDERIGAVHKQAGSQHEAHVPGQGLGPIAVV